MGTLVRSIHRQFLVAALALAGLTCSSDSGSPDGGHEAQVRVQAVLAPAALAAGVPVGQATLTVVSPSADTLLHQTVPYDSGMVVDLPVVLEAVDQDVAVTLTLLMSGTSQFPGVAAFRGHDTVTVESGAPGDVFQVAVAYIGPGANAAQVRITPRDTTVPTGDTLDFDAGATDGAGGPLPVPFVRWSSSAVGSTVAQDGRFLAPAVRGQTFIKIRTPTGLTDSTLVRFIPPPAQVVLQGGNDQQGVVGDTLAQQLTVVVRAADALPVPGVPVTFAAAIGGGSVTLASVVTDSLGVAKTRALLGTTSGAQSFTATVAGVAPATFTATALPGAAHTLAFVVAPADSTRAGTVLIPAPVIEVRDTFGNRVRVGGIPILALMAGVSGVSGEDSVVTDTTGRATFDSLVIAGVVGNDELRFEGTGLAAARKTIRLIAGNPSQLVKIAGDSQVAFLDSAVAVRPRVRVTDPFGNRVPSATVLWSVVAGGGNVTGADTPTDTLGEAAVGSWKVGGVEGENRLRARIAGVDSVEFTATGEATPPAISLTVGDTLVGVGRVQFLTVTLDAAAPAGGVTVTLTNNAPGVVSLDSTTLAFAEGETVRVAHLTGITAGSATISASAPGHLGDAISVTGTTSVVVLPVNSSVAYLGNANLLVSLHAPAPVGGVQVQVTSLDTTRIKVLFSTVTFNAGEQAKITQVQGVRPGSAAVIAGAVGFVPDTSTVTSTAQFDVLQGQVQVFEGMPVPYVITLKSSGNLANAPAGGITANLTARNPACVAINASVAFPAGISTQQDTLQVGAGPFPCTTYVVASAPGVAPDSVQVVADEMPVISAQLPTTDVGAGLQRAISVNLSFGQHGGRNLVVRSLIPSRVKGQVNATTAATDTALIFVPNGTTFIQPVLAGMEGVADTASVVLEMTGYRPDTVLVTVRPAALSLAGANGGGAPNRSTLAADAELQAHTGISVNAGGITNLQALRAGGTLSRTVTFRITTPPGVIGIYDSTGVRDTIGTATFAPGSATSPFFVGGGLRVDAIAPGTATLVASIPGVVSTNEATRNFTITPGVIAFADSVIEVGAGLMSANVTAPNGRVLSLSGPGHTGLEVALKVLTPGVALLQPSDSVVGSDSIGVTFAPGVATMNFVVAGLEGILNDTVLVVAFASGLNPDTVKVVVRRPGLEVQGIIPTMNAADGAKDIFAVIGLPNAGGTGLLTSQRIRPGSILDRTVTFTLSAPGVAELVDLAGPPALVKTKQIPIRDEITPFRVFTGGVGFDPIAPGVVTVTVAMPGVTTVGTGTRTVTVTP
jgi:hypothetical protein